MMMLCMGMVLTMSSCSKDSDGNSVIPTNMSATVGGASWTAILPQAVLTTTGFQIGGTSFDGKAIALTTVGATTKTYSLVIDLTSGSAECGCAYTPSILSPTNIYSGTEGTIKITEIDTTNKTITGTFSFTTLNIITKDQIKIASGKFTKLSYTDTSAE